MTAILHKALAEGQLGQVLMAVAVALIAGTLLLNLRRRHSKLSRSQADPRQRIERDRQIGRMGGDIRQMMVELEALTRRFSAQLDAKTIRLEQLLEKADRKIARLEGRPVSPADDAASGADADDSAQTPEGPVESAAAHEALVRKIYELADAGRSTLEIARQLDEQVGEVELILALRQQGD